MTDPYADFREVQKPGDAAFARLEELVRDLQSADGAVTTAEDELKKAQEVQRDLAERQIPEFMAELGQKQLVLTNLGGITVTVDSKIRASIPANQKIQAMRWLEENGHAALIKRTISIGFSRFEQDQATELMQELTGKFNNLKQDMKVEPSTLTAFVREQLEAGEPVPSEMFGVFEQKFVKIKQPKTRD